MASKETLTKSFPGESVSQFKTRIQEFTGYNWEDLEQVTFCWTLYNGDDFEVIGRFQNYTVGYVSGEKDPICLLDDRLEWLEKKVTLIIGDKRHLTEQNKEYSDKYFALVEKCQSMIAFSRRVSEMFTRELPDHSVSKLMGKFVATFSKELGCNMGTTNDINEAKVYQLTKSWTTVE